jgi:hypothetical protein
MQTRKLVGEMDILVRNEPAAVLQIITVLGVEYKINPLPANVENMVSS